MLIELLLHISSAASALLVLLVGRDVYEQRLAARRRAWICRSCGYDTRGSPGLRCPECNGLIRIVGRERF